MPDIDKSDPAGDRVFLLRLAVTYEKAARRYKPGTPCRRMRLLKAQQYRRAAARLQFNESQER
jgi:hypothetical protein